VIELFKRWFRVLAYDPLRSRRIVRALLVGFGVSTAGLVQLIPDTRWRIPVYMLGGLAGCLGGLLSVGEPNEPERSVELPVGTKGP
jgi:hypothetical protein